MDEGERKNDALSSIRTMFGEDCGIVEDLDSYFV